MVRVLSPGEIRQGSQPAAVKVEVEDHLEDKHGPLSKRSKLAAPPEQQWGVGVGSVSSEAVRHDLLNEPSPLGLRLRKSPSLLDLIQMKLQQANSSASTSFPSNENDEAGKRKDLKCPAGSSASDKMKASNFPASLLRIGTWECISRYEGDLVAKCYYAKHKLVWEVLEVGLKSKIEIQWSDITALKATCPENGPSTLDLVLARQPLFFRETNPQPRKHTLWQATSDFTGGQASIHRRHFLQCPQGLLSKHFEKLIQCDPRLNSLTWQPEIILESPYFEPRCSSLDDQDEFKPASGFHECAASPDASSTSNRSKSRDSIARLSDHVARETPSPSSAMDSGAMEENTSSETEESKTPHFWDELQVTGLKPSMSIEDFTNHLEHCLSEQVPGLKPSMSMKDLANHLEHCISEQAGNGASSLPSKEMLEELTQCLFSDNQVLSASEESSLMSRVNSLCCLLQRETSPAQNFPINNGSRGQDDVEPNLPTNLISESKPMFDCAAPEVDKLEASPCKQPGLSRKESFGELLMQLPRIASMPQFLFNVSEDSESQAR